MTELLLELSSGGSVADGQAISSAGPTTALGPFPQLVDEIRSSAAAVRRPAVALMARLLPDTTDNISRIAKSGGVPPLVDLLRSSEADVADHAVAILANMVHPSLATADEHLDAIAAGGAVAPLVAMLGNGIQRGRANAVVVLSYLAARHGNELGVHGAVPLLLTLLTSAEVSLKEAAARALVGIAASSVSHQDAIRREGGVERLITQLKHESTHLSAATQTPQMAAVLTQLSLAVSALAQGHKANQAAIHSAGGGEALVEILRGDAPEPTKAAAAEALYALAETGANYSYTVSAISLLVQLIGRYVPYP